MATTSSLVRGTPGDVWAVLADPWSYSSWVVGTVKIREADGYWPAVGSKLHHAVGAWPLLIQDETEVLEEDPGRRLVVQARGWPAGEARVELELREAPGGARVTMTESPTHGPGAWVHNPVLELVLARRLAECVDRLRRLVEGRHGTSAGGDQQRQSSP